MSMVKGDKLLFYPRRCNSKTRHSEKVCLKLDGGHTLYNFGPTGKQRNIGGAKFLAGAGEKPVLRIVEFEG